jgi:hypothetical protein
MKNKALFWTLTVIVSVLLIYALAATVVLPVFTKNPLPKAVVDQSLSGDEKKADKKGNKKAKSDDVAEEAVALPDSLVASNKKDALDKLFELRKRERLLQSRYMLASDDSMYLVLDMINKVAILEMHGIALHECKILDYSISNSIQKYHTEKLLNWIAEPFQVERSEATLPKIIFNEKIAPKDTIEAAKAEVIPTAPVQPDVFLVMDFERNLRLVVDQVEEPTKEGAKTISEMKWKYKKTEIRRSVNALLKLNREPVMPQIHIVLPKTDAIIIYRALPVKPKMVLVM